MNNQNLPDNPDIVVQKANKTGLFTNYIYKAIPLAFDESMSYYETLCGLLNYLQNTIIPTVNNNADAVSELQNLYIELKTYVDDYFTNLDVQQEINNKLDEMVEDGTLDNLLLPYFNQYKEDINNNIINFESSVNDQLNTIRSSVSGLASGSPAGVYATLSALTSEDPDHTKIYVVLADGNWYYYNTANSSWTSGGLYQGTEPSQEVIDLRTTYNNLSYEYANLAVNTQFKTLFDADVYFHTKPRLKVGNHITSNYCYSYATFTGTYLIKNLNTTDYFFANRENNQTINYKGTNQAIVNFNNGVLRIYKNDLTTFSDVDLNDVLEIYKLSDNWLYNTAYAFNTQIATGNNGRLINYLYAQKGDYIVSKYNIYDNSKTSWKNGFVATSTGYHMVYCNTGVTSAISESDGYQKEIYVTNNLSPELFGAVGDGTTDDYNAINKYIRFCYDNNINIVNFTKNKTYYVSADLHLFSNTTYNGNNCTLKGGKTSYHIMRNNDINLTQYSGNNNIIIKNFKFNCNNESDTINGAIGLAHTSNCRIINCKFYNKTAEQNHVLDLVANTDLIVKDCYFKDCVNVGQLQIDCADSGSMPTSSTPNLNEDNTTCNNIHIINNTFESCGLSIHLHKNGHNNIFITDNIGLNGNAVFITNDSQYTSKIGGNNININNNIINLTSGNDSHGIVMYANVTNLNITNNIINTLVNGIYVIQNSGDLTKYNNYVNISNNNITAKKCITLNNIEYANVLGNNLHHYDSGNEYAIYLNASTSNVKVSLNNIVGYDTTIQDLGENNYIENN